MIVLTPLDVVIGGLIYHIWTHLSSSISFSFLLFLIQPYLLDYLLPSSATEAPCTIAQAQVSSVQLLPPRPRRSPYWELLCRPGPSSTGRGQWARKATMAGAGVRSKKRRGNTTGAGGTARLTWLRSPGGLIRICTAPTARLPAPCLSSSSPSTSLSYRLPPAAVATGMKRRKKTALKRDDSAGTIWTDGVVPHLGQIFTV